MRNCTLQLTTKGDVDKSFYWQVIPCQLDYKFRSPNLACRNLGSMSTLVKIDKSFGMLNLLIQVRSLLPRDPHHLHATYNCPKGPNSPDNLVIFQRNVIFSKIAARNWQRKFLLDANWHLDRDLKIPVFAEDLDSHGKCYYCCNYKMFIWESHVHHAQSHLSPQKG